MKFQLENAQVPLLHQDIKKQNFLKIHLANCVETT